MIVDGTDTTHLESVSGVAAFSKRFHLPVQLLCLWLTPPVFPTVVGSDPQLGGTWSLAVQFDRLAVCVCLPAAPTHVRAPLTSDSSRGLTLPSSWHITPRLSQLCHLVLWWYLPLS